ncbi:MAG: hypothetical protein LBJ13_03875 [Puniceicoccales bacterium]|nr:hypothetical protein [Puniceicoccales bacterium]
MGEKVNSFTLIELVTVIALVSISLFFLIKLNVAAGNESRQVRTAALLLASSFDDTRGQAIVGNSYVKLFIDTSSHRKFQRIAIMKQRNNTWEAEREILLPERTFIFPFNDLSQYLVGGQSLSSYFEESNILQGEAVDGYCFIFDPAGHLSSPATAAILGIGYGTRVNNSVELKKDINIYGLFITLMGSGIILESKSAIEEAI